MNNNPSVSELLQITENIAFNAGKILLDGFNKVKQISYKTGIHNIVTEYDVLSENYIISSIREIYPNHEFLAEESGKTSQSDTEVRWIIDPLDGTVNYAHGIPIFSVSIAAEVKGQIVCGVIYHPMLNEMFTASKGNGSYLNGVKINVSENSKVAESILVTGFPYNVRLHTEYNVNHFMELVNLGVPIRRLGSAALDLAYVACGRFDGFWEVGLSPWDVAAGCLIVNEAGGVVTQYSGYSYRITDNTILATNGLIHNEFVKFLL